MSELLIVVSIRAKPGTEAELCGDLTPVVEPSRKEPGCLRYELFVDEIDPGRFVFVEHWASLLIQSEICDKLPHHVRGEPAFLHAPVHPDEGLGSMFVEPLTARRR